MWATITKPFAWLMLWLYNVTGNYGVSVIIFALAVNVLLSPFMAKSKKSMMRQSRIQPKLTELQKHYGQDPQNQQKLQQEMQKLYKEEGVTPLSGCLWSLIPFPILIALYSVIRQPLSRMMYLSTEAIEALKTFLVESKLYEIPAKVDAYAEIRLADIAFQNMEQVKAFIAGNAEFAKFQFIDFSFLNMNMGTVPWPVLQGIFNGTAAFTLAALGLILIPFISAGLSWLSMKISNLANPQQGGDEKAQASAKTMQMMMPITSIWICFIMPAAMGIYWIANSVFGMIRDYIFTKKYQKQFAIEDAEKEAMRSEREKELERKREETEKLRAEGKTEQNTNTSKKKLQANEKQKADERKAALERAERQARREMLGIEEQEKPASQVGNRRYARGRAYVEDRYTNPENAEAETLAAALESEDGASIDETVEEEVLTENTAVETENGSEE